MLHQPQIYLHFLIRKSNRKEERELATIEQLKERIKKLEERILVQEETLKKTLDFIQRAIDTQLD